MRWGADSKNESAWTYERLEIGCEVGYLHYPGQPSPISAMQRVLASRLFFYFRRKDKAMRINAFD